MFDNGETESRASGVPGAGLFHSVETFAQPGKVIFRYADSCVADPDDYKFAVF